MSSNSKHGGFQMATRTQSRSSNRSTTNRSSGGQGGGNDRQTSRSSNREGSAFSWGNNNGALVGAALAGAAIGLAANFGRKFLTQSLSGASGDWDEVLATEHDMALAIFDKMLATDDTQTFKRKMLLMK